MGTETTPIHTVNRSRVSGVIELESPYSTFGVLIRGCQVNLFHEDTQQKINQNKWRGIFTFWNYPRNWGKFQI